MAATTATSMRKLFVVCDSRVPAACQALADEQNILGRIVFKSRNAHRRHRHHSYLAATFKALDVLLRNVDSLELKKLAQSVVDCGNALKPTAEPLATLGNQESVQLLQSLEVLQGHAESLQELTKVACAAFHPMVRLGFFVPLALCATALLGRVYTLSGEICEAVSAAAVVLTPTAAAMEPEVGTEVVLMPKAVGTARLEDEDMGVPLAEEAHRRESPGSKILELRNHPQMQELADDYQRALADISSLRAIYDTEIEGLTEELSQCKAAHGEELASLQEQLQSAKAQQEAAKKSQSLQDVLSKRVVQLEAKLHQQDMETDAMKEELEKLRPMAAATAEVEQRATSAEEVLATTAANFQAAEARQLQAEEMVRQLKQRCQSLEAQLSKRPDPSMSLRSDPALMSRGTKPMTRPDLPIKSTGSMPPSKVPVTRVEGPLVGFSSALSPTAPNTPLLETRKVLVQRPNE